MQSIQSEEKGADGLTVDVLLLVTMLAPMSLLLLLVCGDTHALLLRMEQEEEALI